MKRYCGALLFATALGLLVPGGAQAQGFPNLGSGGGLLPNVSSASTSNTGLGRALADRMRCTADSVKAPKRAARSMAACTSALR